MKIQKVNFPKILKDNEETYFRYLEGIIDSVDIGTCVICTRKLVEDKDGVSIRISPSEPAAFHTILEEIKRFHTLLGIQVEFSKSMKAGNNICFSINF